MVGLDPPGGQTTKLNIQNPIGLGCEANGLCTRSPVI